MDPIVSHADLLDAYIGAQIVRIKWAQWGDTYGELVLLQEQVADYAHRHDLYLDGPHANRLRDEMTTWRED